jgi:hypothetical protein
MGNKKTSLLAGQGKLIALFKRPDARQYFLSILFSTPGRSTTALYLALCPAQCWIHYLLYYSQESVEKQP